MLFILVLLVVTGFLAIIGLVLRVFGVIELNLQAVDLIFAGIQIVAVRLVDSAPAHHETGYFKEIRLIATGNEDPFHKHAPKHVLCWAPNNIPYWLCHLIEAPCLDQIDIDIEGLPCDVRELVDI